MFYKKQKLNGKWFPRSFTAGTYTTKDVAERLALMSTVSLSDMYAVLLGLGEVMGDMMKNGNSVKLEGLGTFYLVGQGFIPEYSRAQNGRVTRRTIVPQDVEWIEMG